MRKPCLVLTNTEYDCPIQNDCALNPQLHSRAVSRAPRAVGGFQSGRNLETPKCRERLPQGVSTKSLDSGLSWALPGWQTLHQLSLAKEMLSSYHPSYQFVAINIHFWSQTHGPAGHFCCFGLGSFGLTHASVVSWWVSWGLASHGWPQLDWLSSVLPGLSCPVSLAWPCLWWRARSQENEPKLARPLEVLI